MEKSRLSVGRCTLGQQEGLFINIGQNGKQFFYRYKQSQNGLFVTVWNQMGNYQEEKSNQVCLLDNSQNVLWCQEFRRADSCCVSNNGIVVVRNLNPVMIKSSKGVIIPSFLNSLIVIPLSKEKMNFDLGTDEAISFELSPDGKYLIYNLQQYNPESYRLIFFNIQTKREEWRFKYPQDIVVHELIFKENHILVYAGPRPSAFIERRYSFTLDLNGQKIETDLSEVQKDKEKEEVQNKILQIITYPLVNISPTLVALIRGQKEEENAWSSITKGQTPLPAIYVQISPGITPDPTSIISHPRFHLSINVFARTPEERDKTVETVLLALSQSNDKFVKNGLVISTLQQKNCLSSDGSLHQTKDEFFRSWLSETSITTAKFFSFPTYKNFPLRAELSTIVYCPALR